MRFLVSLLWMYSCVFVSFSHSFIRSSFRSLSLSITLTATSIHNSHSCSSFPLFFSSRSSFELLSHFILLSLENDYTAFFSSSSCLFDSFSSSLSIYLTTNALKMHSFKLKKKRKRNDERKNIGKINVVLSCTFPTKKL